MKLDQILKSAEAFEKLAALDFAAVCKNYGYAIQQEVAGGIRAINKLVTSNKIAANSRSLESLDSIFAKIADTAQQLSSSSIDISLQELKSYLGNATFYTNTANMGTGYDPVTHTGGAWSPAAYINRIQTIVNNLEKWSKYNTKPVKNVTRHDPSLPSV